MSIFNDDFGSSMPSLSLTLNPAFSGKPRTLNPEPVNGYWQRSSGKELSQAFTGSEVPRTTGSSTRFKIDD